ncbi:hypothetical protein [Micromonospora chokoriensis]|uniref:Uncharacterized protein n=1 Tax=Micromonospora chokoriensis TaxID=356851 RepID=A0A1C4U4W9_9ACTN|nr:hypothetical protein [Micromonospora chokoriensis]SCE66712.1 hypothetical protein GA0070612_0092 [Micromonospora chokoriensis]
MQPEGPYRFTHALGGSPVGKAWAAIDEQGRFVTVAVLDATVAATAGWREAFSGAADLLAQSADPTPYTYADFSAAAPWVAYAAEVGPGAEKLFRALGVDYTPAPTSAPPTSAPPSSAPPSSAPPFSAPPAVSAPPVSAPPQPVSGGPPAPWAVQAAPIPSQLVSASPHPVSGAPTSPAGVTSAPPAFPMPTSGPGGDAFSSPTRRIAPSAPKPQRTGLWIGIAALVLVVLAGAGALAFMRGSDDKPTDVATSSSPVPPPMPATPPQSPGTEPPQGGKWPAQWPTFTERDNVRTLANLEGLGFPVKVPLDWNCTIAGQAEGFVKYNCGRAASGESTMGGELIVRNCPQPCDERRQTAMRMAEEAWGTRWIRSGQSATFGEALLNVDGEQRHGLVVVAYYRGGPDGVVDRQIVLRLTGPMQEANQLRRIATYLRDVLVF